VAPHSKDPPARSQVSPPPSPLDVVVPVLLVALAEARLLVPPSSSSLLFAVQAATHNKAIDT
jgi:hypothetical protein